MNPRPTVLSISGHDPSGGAGIQADIEAISGNGARACSIITALTVQNSVNLSAIEALEPDFIRQQFTTLTTDIPISVVKIGMLATAAIAKTVADLLSQLKNIPLVLDPVLASGAGQPVADQHLIDAILQHLCPLTTLITPNSIEARRLSGAATLDDAAAGLLKSGCKNILITGTHEDSKNVVNRLFMKDNNTIALECPRLEGVYHGSGCTLASSIAAQLARGLSVSEAVEQAQQYTYQTLLAAEQVGTGQRFPVRTHSN